MAPSIIGEDLSVTGNIISKGAVQVDGEIEGDIHCSSLVVGEKAHVSGGLMAEDVVVYGRVTGSIQATRVTLQASSHVEGDIHHQSIAIEQGAYFEGKSRHSDNPTEIKIETPKRPQKASAQTQSAAPPAAKPASDAGTEDDAEAPRAAE